MRYVPVFYNIVSGKFIPVLRWGGKAVQGKNRQATIFSVDVQLKVHSFSNGKHNREVFLGERILEADNKIKNHNHFFYAIIFQTTVNKLVSSFTGGGSVLTSIPNYYKTLCD